MTKFIFLLSVGLVVGCSNASKKQTTETKAEGPTTATAAAAPAPVEAKKEETKKSKAADSKSEAKVAAEVTCTSNQDVRKLAIKGKDQGCELEYTKGGQASSVASQIVGQAKCEEVSTRIQDKLIAAGYKCE